jgi:DNA-directed RNA polymerase sigma subunit (sigma70/sigma32)
MCNIIKFIENNTSLINEYESLENAISLDYCSDEITNIYNRMVKVDKTVNFNNVLSNAIKQSIKYNTSVLDSMETIFNEMCLGDQSLGTTQIYFKEINDIYTRNNNNFDIEYCEENKDKLLSMNLKTVISIAKNYQGMGLTLPELISAGNLGLSLAWDKFDPNRAKLKNNMLDAVNDLDEEVTFNELYNSIQQFLEYGDVQKKFLDKFDAKHIYTKKEVIKWINSNIHSAKFNSIASMWIKAYILIEIDNNSRVVKKPKSEIYKDKEKDGVYTKEITIDIDAPADSDSDAGMVFKLEDESLTDLEVAEAYKTYKNGLNLLLDGVKPRDRAIFLKKYGIGLPRPMLPKEIAEQEGLSIARVSQIFQTVAEQMLQNQRKYNVDIDKLFSAVQYFK